MVAACFGHFVQVSERTQNATDSFLVQKIAQFGVWLARTHKSNHALVGNAQIVVALVLVLVANRYRNHHFGVKAVDFGRVLGVVRDDRSVTLRAVTFNEFGYFFKRHVAFYVNRKNYLISSPRQNLRQSWHFESRERPFVVFQTQSLAVFPVHLPHPARASGSTFEGFVVQHHWHTIFGKRNITFNDNGHLFGQPRKRFDAVFGITRVVAAATVRTNQRFLGGQILKNSPRGTTQIGLGRTTRHCKTAQYQ